MLTRRKSSEQFNDPPTTKKVKRAAENGTNFANEAEEDPKPKKEDGLKGVIADIKTRKLLRARGITSLFPI